MSNKYFPDSYPIPKNNKANILGIDFFFNTMVLQPRKKTETLITAAISRISKIHNESKKLIKIVDVGTGSGIIVISIAKKLPPKDLIFYATDISFDALRVAQFNSRMHELADRMFFINCDLISCFNFQPDVIIANLPYTPHYDYKTSNTKDPPIAVYDEGNGTQILFRLIDQIRSKERLPFSLLVESTPDLIPKIMKYMFETINTYPKETNIFPDQKNQPRVLEFTW